MVHKKRTPQYECVLFDMDGVLVNSLEVWITVGLEGIKELNIDSCTREDMIKAIVKFETIAKHGITDLKGFGTRINELFAERVMEIQPQKNILPALEHLQTNSFKTGVITSSGKKAVQKILENLDLQKYFDIVVTFDDVAKHKPDPEGLMKAMQHLHVEPAKTIMVGDTRNDILAGKRAGCTTIMYYPDWHETIYDRDHLLGLGADYYIRDLQEIIDIVG